MDWATPERRWMIETAKKLCPSAVEDIEGGYFYQACRLLLTELQRAKAPVYQQSSIRSAKRAKLST